MFKSGYHTNTGMEFHNMFHTSWLLCKFYKVPNTSPPWCGKYEAIHWCGEVLFNTLYGSHEKREFFYIWGEIMVKCITKCS
jgi:hypothetical protein